MQPIFMLKKVSVLLSGMCIGMMFVVIGHANTIIGGESLAAECFAASQAAVLNGTSNRIHLDVCTRAIKDVHLSTENLAGSYVNRGVIYMAIKRPDDALKDINRALGIDGNTAEAYLNRGNIWFATGEITKAVVDYDLAIKLGVQKVHVAHLNRGIARESLGYLSAAQRDYQAALEAQPEWSEALSRLDRVNKTIQQEIEKRELTDNKK
jgi:tetratricopeptide (TPR) repeat protein